MTDELTITVTEQDGAHVVVCKGELTLANKDALKEQLKVLIEAQAPRIIVDMAEVEWIDSSGLGVLIGAYKRIQQYKGAFDLVVIDKRSLRYFQITGMDTIFDIHPDLASALAGGR